MLIHIDDMLVNLAHVQSIRPLPVAISALPRSEIVFADGTVLTARRGIDWFERFTGTIIPAPPGYSVMDASPNEPGSSEPVWFNITPVIAFRHTGSEGGPVTPITDEGEQSEGGTWVLVKPTGECASWDRFWPSVEAWRAEMVKLLAADATVAA